MKFRVSILLRYLRQRYILPSFITIVKWEFIDLKWLHRNQIFLWYKITKYGLLEWTIRLKWIRHKFVNIFFARGCKHSLNNNGSLVAQCKRWKSMGSILINSRNKALWRTFKYNILLLFIAFVNFSQSIIFPFWLFRYLFSLNTVNIKHKTTKWDSGTNNH